MNEIIITIITGIIGLVGGGGIMSLFLVKSKKKISFEEGVEKEISNLRLIIETSKQEIQSLKSSVTDLYQQLGNRDAMIVQLREEKNILEIKHHLNKSCINKGLSCEHSSVCPVILAKKKNDDDYSLKIRSNETK
jgi:hypothetical protein